MTRWLDDLAGELGAGEACVLVTVARIDGSAPREPGARMVVTQGAFRGTIGGGQLEWDALETARAQLAATPGAWIKRYPLGPELGQCCGGVVSVLFEPYSPADAAWVEQLCALRDGPKRAVRVIEVSDEGEFARHVFAKGESDEPDDEAVRGIVRLLMDAATGGFMVRLDGQRGSLVETLEDRRQPLWLFGAGHVGQAVVQALAPLPFHVTWIDCRANVFPEDLAAGVTARHVTMPGLIVDEAPPGAMFLVMTHSHGLDQDICEAVLCRGDAGYLGLIGAKTKKARFLSRLAAKGLDAPTLASIHCPIGVPGIEGKDPAVIAASVAADLLTRLEETRAASSLRAKSGGSINV
ncbi:MAG: xanthine dehydrogenase accessory protein XdhC [Hyphomicrobiales bacterium]